MRHVTARALQSRCVTASPLSIGNWQVDPGAHELSRAGTTVHLEPKVMNVLMRLAEDAGSVVTREQLFDAAWPGAVVVDEALTQTIIKLRRALGDDRRAPEYIETISKRGYRLIAPVGPPASQSASAPAQVPVAIPERRALRQRWAAVAFAVLAAVAILGAAVFTPFVRPPPAPSGPDAGHLTVTVVPFEALGGSADQGYLARGISNDLMTDLSRLADLQVIRPGSPVDAPAGARYVVTGTVQRDADTLRINVQLTDSSTKRQLWSERFERPYGDLFAVQDAITRGLVHLLPGKLQDAAKQTAAQRYTKNLAAYDRFLRGQEKFLMRRAQDNETAREYYRSAIELDPTFARAYAGMAMTYALDPRLRGSPDAAPALARALELAETARQIDPDIHEVYWAIAFVLVQQRRHDEALALLKKAVALNPSYADAYALMAGVYTYVGEPARSIPLLRTALRLDPGGGYLYFMVLGRAYLFQGDTEQALINLREAATRNPVDVETRLFLTAALAASNDTPGAEWQVQEIRSLEPAFSLHDWLRTYPLTDAGQRQRLSTLLAAAGL